ncbi:MAG: hypothetical protein HUJ25_14785 [Crocinitomicaceae bacterium]|nr:hypothetical protein [Crocinitomicaceae bacterium]
MCRSYRSSAAAGERGVTQNGNDFSPEALNRLLRPLKALYPSKNLTALAIRQSVISNWINGQHLSIEQVQTLSGQKWLSTTEKYKRNVAFPKRGRLQFTLIEPAISGI